MPEIDAEITRLSNEYYDLIQRDHHKDRDCHFYIKKRWSYGGVPVYVVDHLGYLNEFHDEFTTPQAAHIALRDFLRGAVAAEVSEHA